jgi:hypothetical protein
MAKAAQSFHIFPQERQDELQLIRSHSEKNMEVEK